jgi:glycosyltransferase involved in cell wall biosynthesis
MKILKVIHGYPPDYNAGSEVYSQTLCNALAKNHVVHVFTREENPFLPDYHIREETDQFSVTKHMVNIPLLRQRYRYNHSEIDVIFAGFLDRLKPDIVHIGHLNHLSLSLLEKIKERDIPIVFTLHDYWLICPRGQFIQRNACEPWQHCENQEDEKCARNCYSGYFSGTPAEQNSDVSYWTDWIARRRLYIEKALNYVDLFIAPSRYLLERFQKDLKIPSEKLIYLDYGFDLKRLQKPERIKEEDLVFGYIGTHTPQKGIHLLLEAFSKVQGPCKLKIWGRARSEVTPALKQIVSTFLPFLQEKIEWQPEYANDAVVSDVFNHVDVIVVPSIWVENSPLVIHEAQQAGVPVITADIGGMKEYVEHEVNGLLFAFRNSESLAFQMQRLVDNSALVQKLKSHRYLYSADGDIPDISTHTQEMVKIYSDLSAKKRDFLDANI